MALAVNNRPGCRVVAFIADDSPRYAGYRIDCECERNDLQTYAWKLTFMRPNATMGYTFDSFSRIIIERRFHYVHLRLRRQIVMILRVDPVQVFFKRSGPSPN